MWMIRLFGTETPETMAEVCNDADVMETGVCPATGEYLQCPFPGVWCCDVTPEMWEEVMEDDDSR